MTAALTPPQRAMLRGQAIAGFALNFVLNGAAAWATFPPVPTLPLFARGNCVAGDTIGTSFFLPLVTCLVLTSITRRGLRAGRITAHERAALPALVRALPRNAAARGALVGLACAASVALVTLAALSAAGATALSRDQVTLFKAVYTAVLGACVTPLFGLRALGDAAAAPPS